MPLSAFVRGQSSDPGRAFEAGGGTFRFTEFTLKMARNGQFYAPAVGRFPAWHIAKKMVVLLEQDHHGAFKGQRLNQGGITSAFRRKKAFVLGLMGRETFHCWRELSWS